MLRHYCRASGMIHYARMDDNPRAPYEGLSAGTPLFASYESLLHETVYAQPFVTSISYQENDPAAFRSRFGQFMSHVRDVEQLKPEMQVFIQQHLTPESIYRKICAEMGICE